MVDREALFGISKMYENYKYGTTEQAFFAMALHLTEHCNNYASRGCRLGHMLDAKEFIDNRWQILNGLLNGDATGTSGS